ncbi:MAG: hypothetical protein KAT04_02500 [Methylococcales bacterium]|nr:hypothetical protein [Methylococcales bacterium]
MKKIAISLLTLLLIILLSACQKNENDQSKITNFEEPSPQSKEILARCLTDKGFVMYGSITCSACRAQRKLFGKAFEYITDIECNPNAPGNQIELCLKKKIRKTPTWILEKDEKEIKRMESYQLLEDLESFAECDIKT